jgi:shikimate 5-dehydrogenase/shikimate kinase
MRCAGKSSLASIAARALKWKVLDEKRQFEKTTGYSVAEYIQQNGMSAYYAEEANVLQGILSDHPRGCIIVCSSSCLQSQYGRDILRRYLAVMPIVHVMRDPDILQSSLEKKWNGDVTGILRKQEPIYLACSNLTFFNVDDSTAHPQGQKELFDTVICPLDQPSQPSLSLKRLEADFLRFLSSVYGDLDYHDECLLPYSANLTYALQLPFQNFSQPGIDLETFCACADILHVRTDRLLQGYHSQTSPNQQWWEYIITQLAYLRRKTAQPILCHPTSLDSIPAEAEPGYFNLVQLALRIGVEYIALDIAREESQLSIIHQYKGHTKFVGWVHEADPTVLGGWDSQGYIFWYHKAKAVGCDILHITQPAIFPSDNAAAQRFAYTLNRNGESPIVSAYNTGRLGRPSQCHNKQLTLIRHPDDLENEGETVTILEAQHALFNSFVCEPLKFFVLGATIRYSVAPILHNSAFELYGMPHHYYISQTDTLDTLDILMQDPHMGGLGLASPFKTSILPRLHSMSDEARAIGAVNTILPIRTWNNSSSGYKVTLEEQRNRAGPVVGLYGANTDWKGIRSCAFRYLSPANAVTCRSTALVIGAGGMARAAIYAMTRLGIEHICIYNRTCEHALDVASHFGRQSRSGAPNPSPFAEKHPRTASIIIIDSLDDPWPSNLRFPTVIINCSPVPSDSIQPQTSQHNRIPELEPAVSIPNAWLKSPTGGVYLELAYNSSTPSPELVRICSEEHRGWIGVPGLEIFLEVAAAQFQFWTGRTAPKCSMKKKLDQYLRTLAISATCGP